MTQVAVEIEIAAPREAIFAAMLDPERLGDWVTIHRSVEWADGGRLRKGYAMEQTLALRGAPFTVHWVLSEFDPPGRAAWTGKGPGGSDARTAYRLSELPGGSTRFEYLNEYRPPGGVLGRVAGRALVGGLSEREARKSLERLKALVEH